MRGIFLLASFALVACGGNGSVVGPDDTSMDESVDMTDTQSDTSSDPIPDTHLDSPSDVVADTHLDPTEDPAIDTSTDEIEEDDPACECSGINECCDGCTQINGCWLDPTTGILWEDPPMGGGYNSWDSAIAYCAALTLAGHETGEWRMPTISELRTFVRGCPSIETGGSCGLTDTCIEGSCLFDCPGCCCDGPGMGGCYWDPAVDGLCTNYWSSSAPSVPPDLAWTLNYLGCQPWARGKASSSFVRCIHVP